MGFESIAVHMRITGNDMDHPTPPHHDPGQYRDVFEHISDALFQVDVTEDGRYLVDSVNPAYERLFHIRHADVAGRYVDEVVPADLVEVFTANYRRCIAAGIAIEYDETFDMPTGHHVCQTTLIPVHDAKGRVRRIVGIARDVTGQKQREQQLLTLAYYDALTGLPNRTSLDQQLEQQIRSNQGIGIVGLLLLDLDHFSAIVDALGHRAGDDLLRRTAARLKERTRRQDVVARLGGDEFALILPHANTDAALQDVAAKLLASFAEPFQLGDHEIFVTASIGIARYPLDGHSAQELLQHADSALYLAKDRGRNNYQFCSPSLVARKKGDFALIGDLRHAVRNSELTLAYQPQVELASGRLTGAEALLRWQHPTRGWIPPVEFIPLAEQTGQIVAIGEWVLRTACQAAAAWNRLHGPLRIAVNLSPLQFKHGGLVEQIRQTLDDTGCRPEWLTLEITEGLLLDDTIDVQGMLSQLRALGFSIAIDDFGTGYSALGYLNRFPIDILKIDRSFVAAMDQKAGAAELVKAIIAMSHSLGLKLVAEGVEQTSQAAFLEAHGCQYAQGYLFSRPLPEAELEAQLQADSHIGQQVAVG